MRTGLNLFRACGSLALAGLLAACGITENPGTAQAKLSNDKLNYARAHVMPMAGSGAPSDTRPMSTAQSTASNSHPHLTYYGGPVISNVKIFTVFWTKDVSNQSQIENYYQVITQSPYFDWLKEYDTPTQQIGRGSWIGSYVASLPTPSLITDDQIEQGLSSMIGAGVVPQPDDNTLYMIYFPHGMTVDLQGARSCTYFCAYHMSFNLNGQRVFYGVFPDTSDFLCSLGCGGDLANKINNVTQISSHEMIEATTDADVGEAATMGPPLAWYDADTGGIGGGQWGEIGDICAGTNAVVEGQTVQREWSNKWNACIATAPACTPNCNGKTCGDDGCGGVCGVCAQGQYCVNNNCSNTCTPQCNGKTCGADGCGGVCGTCPNGDVCTNGQCYSSTCQPNCNKIICNTNDGCGGKCGCVTGQSCFLLVCI